MQITNYGNYYWVSIPFGHWHKRNTDAVKEIEGRRFLFNEKVWEIPGSQAQEIEKLVKYHKATLTTAAAPKSAIIGELKPMPELDIELPLVTGELRHYQTQGVARGMELERYINGDEPGLGKTVQSIMTLVGIEKKGGNPWPAIVICPASLKENWRREFEKFAGVKAMVLADRVKNTWHRYYETGMAKVFIVNYESLKKYFVLKMPPKGGKSKDILMHKNIELFQSLIIDESHRCKSTSTLQSKLCLRMAVGKKYRILLTGTPVVNKPSDLLPQLIILGQHQHFGGNIKAFNDRYCAGGNGTSNLKELHYLLYNHCFFRREKKEVAKDLPAKDRQIVLCDITTREEYNTAKNNFVTFLENSGFTDDEIAKKLRGEILVQMNSLRAISARGKINEVKEFVDEIVESGEKIILFCSLKSIVQQMKEIYPEAVTITGSDTNEERQRAIDGFQSNPKIQVIICNIKAAGVGVTLTASSRVAFIEYPWTAADCIQCEDRAHRIGQVWPVMCTYFMGAETIDEYMWQLINEKKDIANQITGGSDDMQTSTIDKLLTLFKK